VTGEAQKNLRSAAKDTEAGHIACHLFYLTQAPDVPRPIPPRVSPANLQMFQATGEKAAA
jgi:hypothetical protein